MSESRGHQLLHEALFRGALVRERKRADRSERPLALLLVGVDEPARMAGAMRPVLDALTAAKRETDVIGWFDRQSVGVILPDVPPSDPTFARVFDQRVQTELVKRLNRQALGGVSVRLHVHPAPKQEVDATVRPVDPLLQTDQAQDRRSRLNDSAKRVLDIAGSAAALIVLSPLFLLIAALVKLTSPGPVFFRQQRVGQSMKPFTMLKFRTMHVNANHAIHHEFMTSFIHSGAQAQEAGKKGLFKIANDPRVTSIGRILRKTSLDEVPQFWNVLRGDMSLVGPRPPIQYEVDQYRTWHCRRVLEAKPGITGLWQVAGRSRTTFDDMVRLDLRYAKTPSVWTDVKILLQTPAAIIAGKGAC